MYGSEGESVNERESEGVKEECVDVWDVCVCMCVCESEGQLDPTGLVGL